ncbi:MAG: hypothetical protein AAF960_01855 [Bacteroidota bacterium]
MNGPNFKVATSLLFIFSLAILFFPISVVGQETAEVSSTTTLFKTFQQEDLLKITIKTATKQLVAKKYKEDWQPIELSFTDKAGTTHEWPGKVRARGNIRKQVCYYPPLKLKFKKKWLLKNGMDSAYNDLKLVVGCKKGDAYGDLVLKEYLVYKMYEALTGISFRTQLVEAEFIDTEDRWKPFTTYAFLIENEDEMAKRLNAKCAKPRRLRSKYIYADQLDKMALFEYMIGNTDWSAQTSHNVRIIKCKDYKLPLPIAYDFDYSGFVNAPYAVHGEDIDLDNVMQRLYLGMCREEGVLERQIPVFQEKKAVFYQIIDDFHYLDEKKKKQIMSYLDDFYKTLDNPKIFKRNILAACRENGR